MALKWLAVDTIAGAVICHLPSVIPSGPLRRTIGRYESQTAQLIVTDSTSPSWPNAVTPFQSILVAYDGPAGSERVAWAGVVVQSTRTLGNVIDLSLATPEVYLDRRYVGTYDAVGRDANLVVTDLVSQFCGPLPALPGSFGMPFSTQVIGDPGLSIDRHDTPQSDKTVYSVLGEVSALKGGPQWMVTMQWARNPDRITPVLTVGAMVGNRQTPGLGPVAIFRTPMVSEASYQIDYSSGRGANVVTASGSGQGSARPQQIAPQNGTPWDQPQRPVIEYRYTPAMSIGDIGFLQSHADEARGLLADGLATVSLTAETLSAPKLGSDWDLGDDIGYEIDGAAFPSKVTGVAQCVGVEVTPTTVKPYLYTGVIY